MQSTSLYTWLFGQYRGERVSEQPGTPNETARIEAFSDGVFAIAITLLILEIRVPPQTHDGVLRDSLRDLWPSYVAFLASLMTIGVMWLNHHRLFSLINKKDDGLSMFNVMWRYAIRRNIVSEEVNACPLPLGEGAQRLKSYLPRSLALVNG